MAWSCEAHTPRNLTPLAKSCLLYNTVRRRPAELSSDAAGPPTTQARGFDVHDNSDLTHPQKQPRRAGDSEVPEGRKETSGDGTGGPLAFHLTQRLTPNQRLRLLSYVDRRSSRGCSAPARRGAS